MKFKVWLNATPDSGTRRSIVGIALVLCLSATALAATAPTAATPVSLSQSVQEPAVDSDGDGDLDQPTAIAAAEAARLQEVRVENIAKRTETTRTFANPDGTWSDEVYSTSMRVEESDGTWENVDYDLVENPDGSLAPAVSPNDVRVSGGGSTEAARLTLDDGASLAISWPTTLPEPIVEGGVATYEISPSTDLIVSTTSNGVATRIRLNAEPAADDPVFTLGLRADDLDVEQVASGGLKVTDEDGKQVGSTTQLMAWDAVMDEGGDPKNVVPVSADLDEVSSIGDITKSDLDLKVMEGFLSDPATVYPVTIDPDLSTIRASIDTWVRSGTTTVNGYSYRLQAGRISDSSNTNPVYSYIKWNPATFQNFPAQNRVVKRATIHLFSYLAGSCSGRRLNLAPLGAAFNETSTVYTNAPGTLAAGATYMTQNRGRNGCAGAPNEGNNGYVEGDITAMASSWADGTIPNYGMRLNVPTANASDITYERRFCSKDLDSADDVCKFSYFTPYLVVTYNTKPDAPTGLRIAKLSPDADEIACGAVLGNMTDPPRVQSEVTDPDGNTVTPHYQWVTLEAPTVPHDTPDIPRASGDTSTMSLPVGSTNGGVAFQAVSQDSIGDWGPVSSPCTFIIDRTLPGNPTIEDLPPSWDPNVPYTVTFTPGGDDVTKTVGYAVTFNNPTPPTAKQFDADGPGHTKTQAIMPDPDDGFNQKIRLWAYSQSGAISAIPFTQSIEIF